MFELEIQEGKNWKTNPHWLMFYSEGHYRGSVWSTEAKLLWNGQNYSLRVGTILFLHFTGILLRPKGGQHREWIKLRNKTQIEKGKLESCLPSEVLMSRCKDLLRRRK